MPETKFVKEMYDTKDLVKVKSKAKTHGIRFCVASLIGEVKNKKIQNPRMAHLFPDGFFIKSNGQQFLQKLQDALLNIPEEKTIKGLIIGGVSEAHDENGRLSVKLLRFLKENTEHIKEKDFTIMFSQTGKKTKFLNAEVKHSPETAYLYWRERDTYYVNCGSRSAHNMEEFKDILDKDGIRNHFEFIKPSENDNFFTGSERIPNEFLEKNDFVKKPSVFFPF